MTRYNQPERGSTDWDVPLNENFEDLGVDVEYRDEESQLSEYTPADGAKFLSTTTDSDGYHPVYLGDGNSWNQIGTIGDLASIETNGGSGDPADIDALSVYDVYVYELGTDDYEAVDSSGTTIDSGSNGWVVLESAINAVDEGGSIYISGDYHAQNRIIVEKSVDIYGFGATIHNDNISDEVMRFEGNEKGWRDLSASADAGDLTIELSDASDVSAGDSIAVQSPDRVIDAGTSGTYALGEGNIVESVSGDTVTLHDPLTYGYSTADNSQAMVAGSINVNVYGVHFQGTDEAGTERGLRLRYVVDSTVRNCSFDQIGDFSLSIQNGFAVNVFDCHFERGYNISDSDGYGVVVQSGSSHTRVSDCTFIRYRHAVAHTSGINNGRPRESVISNCGFFGGHDGSVIDMHQGTLSAHIINNTIVTQHRGIINGALKVSIRGNRIYGMSNTGQGIGDRGSGHTGLQDGHGIIWDISDNIIEGFAYGMRMHDIAEHEVITISNNKIQHIGLKGIEIEENIEQAHVSNNTLIDIGDYGIQFDWHCTHAFVTGNYIRDCGNSGIRIDSGQITATNNYLNNAFTSSDAAIRCDSDTGGNFIALNTIYDPNEEYTDANDAIRDDPGDGTVELNHYYR